MKNNLIKHAHLAERKHSELIADKEDKVMDGRTKMRKGSDGPIGVRTLIIPVNVGESSS